MNAHDTIFINVFNNCRLQYAQIKVEIISDSIKYIDDALYHEFDILPSFLSAFPCTSLR